MEDKFLTETFGSWEVIEVVDRKKFRYKCRCSECGEEKVFIKYNLQKGKYKVCSKECLKNHLDIKLIKKYWNSELNGSEFNFNLINTSKKYWFTCDNNHNFKSKIVDFNLLNCTGCKRSKTNKSVLEVIVRLFKECLEEYRLNYKEIYNNVFIIDSLALIVHVKEFDRYKTIRKYFKNEKEYLKELSMIDLIKSKNKKFYFEQIDCYQDKHKTLCNLKKYIDKNFRNVL